MKSMTQGGLNESPWKKGKSPRVKTEVTGGRMNLREESPFATKEQELLLQAAHLKGADAMTALREWKLRVDFESDLDLSSYRLLPLLYTNLLRNNIDDQYMNRLKGIYRRNWYENQKLFHHISRIVRYLQDAGMRIILLKGAALTLLYYKNYGVRPMADIDVLVPFSQAPATINLLKDAGWQTVSGSMGDALRYSHSRPFYDHTGMVLDLHWHLLVETCCAGPAANFEDSAVPVRLNDVGTYALNPTDTLLHVIVHGVRGEDNIRWIPDALSIIHSAGPGIDWPRITAVAKEYRVVLRVKKALNYLYDKFQAGIPEPVMTSINQLPVSRLEHMEYRYMMGDDEDHTGTLLGGFPLYLSEYLRLSYREGWFAKIGGLPGYLEYKMHHNSFPQLIFYLIQRSLRIMKKKLPPHPVDFSRP
jgi:hypothetical protein